MEDTRKINFEAFQTDIKEFQDSVNEAVGKFYEKHPDAWIGSSEQDGFIGVEVRIAKLDFIANFFSYPPRLWKGPKPKCDGTEYE